MLTIILSLSDWRNLAEAARAGMPDVEPALKDDTYDAILRLEAQLQKSDNPGQL